MNKILTLPPNVAAVEKLAAKYDQARYAAMAGVKLSAIDGHYQLEATDGRCLGILRGPNDGTHPAAQTLEQAPNGALNSVVPIGFLKKAVAQLPKGKNHGDNLKKLAVALGDKETTVAATDLDTVVTLRSRNVEGRFPNAEMAFKHCEESEPTVKVCFDAKYLVDLLNVALAITDSDANRVTLEIWDDKKPMLVRTRNTELQQEFTGALVPLIVNGRKGV